MLCQKWGQPKVLTVNGEMTKVKVDGKTIHNNAKKRTYIAFNKPVGIVCTTDTSVEKNNIIDFHQLS